MLLFNFQKLYQNEEWHGEIENNQKSGWYEVHHKVLNTMTDQDGKQHSQECVKSRHLSHEQLHEMPLVELQDLLLHISLNLEDNVNLPDTVECCVPQVDEVQCWLVCLATVVVSEEEREDEGDDVVGNGPVVQLTLDGWHQFFFHIGDRLSVVLETEGFVFVVDQ